MPRTPIDYSKTLIYKLVKNDDYDNANIYIGSTTDFTRRKSEHKKSCNNEKYKEYNAKKSQYIRANGGWGEWLMVEIEKYPCNDGNETRTREEYWRSHFNAQLNTNRAYRTDDQDKEHRKVYDIEYREQNRDKLLEQKKERYEQNKDKILEQKKEYYKQNKDKLLEQQREYNEQNKDKILEKKSQQIICECGCILTKGCLIRHRKSQNHLSKVSNIS